MRTLKTPDPLMGQRYQYNRLKRLVLSQTILLEFFKKGLHRSYVIHSDEVPNDAEILDMKFDKSHKELHFVLHSKEFEHVGDSQTIPHLIPIAMKVDNNAE